VLARSVLVIALLALPLLGRVPPASASGGLSASTTGHGVRITLSVPQASYPRNALIQASIRVTNLSSHAIEYYPGSICGGNPEVEVTNNRGIVEYPPAIAGAPIPSCGPARLHYPQIRPGATKVWHSYAILGGAHLQAHISITQSQLYVYSPTVTAHLISAPPLVAALRVSPRVTLQITPPTTATGPLLYASWWGCKVSNGAEFGGGGIGWQEATGDILSPDWDRSCGTQREWHVVAGWVGQPVVVANVGPHVEP